MIVFPGWDINSSFLLDQMRRQDKSISFEEENYLGELRGSGYSIDVQTMKIWSLALEDEKPTLMKIKESPRGNVIFWNVHFNSKSQIYGMHTSVALLGKNKMDVIQAQLEGAYERFIKTRRQYVEQMKKNFVLEKKTLKLENEIVALKNTIKSAIEIQDKGV